MKTHPEEVLLGNAAHNVLGISRPGEKCAMLMGIDRLFAYQLLEIPRSFLGLLGLRVNFILLFSPSQSRGFLWLAMT